MPSRTPTTSERVKAILDEHFDPDASDDAVPAAHREAIVHRLEDEFLIRISDAQAMQLRTLDDVVRLVERLRD